MVGGGIQCRRAGDFLPEAAFVSGSAAAVSIAAALFEAASTAPSLPRMPPPPPLPSSTSATLADTLAAASSVFASVPFYCELGIDSAHRRLCELLAADDLGGGGGTADDDTAGRCRSGRPASTSDERGIKRLQDVHTLISQSLSHSATTRAQGAQRAGAPESRASADGRSGERAKKLQHAITALLEKSALRRLEARLSLQDREHLTCCRMRGAYEWLTTVPHTWELTIVAAHYRIALARRFRLPVLGTEVLETRSRCGCKTRPLWDGRATHAFTSQCAKRNRLHDRVAAVFYMAANAAGWSSHMATSADSLTPEGSKRQSRLVDIVLHGALSTCPPSGMVSINIDVEMPAVETGDIVGRMRRAAARTTLCVLE